MSEIRLGDRIAAMDSATGQLVYSEVLLFLDRDPNRHRRFVTLLTESGSRLSLTETHLIHVATAMGGGDGCPEAGLSSCFRPTYAGSVEVGQHVLVAATGDDGGSTSDFRVETVVAVSWDSYRGVYAPLTAAGTLVVDSVVASCYAVIDSQSVAHAAFGPLRLWSNARQTLYHVVAAVNWSTSSSLSSPSTTTDGSSSGDSSAAPRTGEAAGVSGSRTTVPPIGVHWYADLLYSVARWLMPSHMVL